VHALFPRRRSATYKSNETAHALPFPQLTGVIFGVAIGQTIRTVDLAKISPE
jgi:hypothetical protein